MTSLSKIVVLIIFLIPVITILLSGCTELQTKRDSLLIPPDVIGNEQLICTSEDMKLCSGFLTQKDIIKEK